MTAEQVLGTAAAAPSVCPLSHGGCWGRNEGNLDTDTPKMLEVGALRD